jgi:hypothetical protein
VRDLSAEAHEQRARLKQLQAESGGVQRDLLEALASIRQDVSALAARHDAHASATADALAAIRRDLDGLAVREAQLRAVAAADLDQIEELPALDRLLADAEAIHAHVRAAIDGATLHQSPYPYTVIDNALPRPVFDALVAGLPPAILFAGKPVNHQHLKPPFELAPVYSRRIWGFLGDALTDDFLRPALIEKFKPAIDRWLRDNFPAHDGTAAPVRLTCSDGRLLLRRRGYRIPPHRDPKWAVLTGLVYLPRPGDDEQWGTQLYSVAGDREAQGAKPHWIAQEDCRLEADVAFRPNRLLVFVNGVGAHGAFIPDDAEPADLERYAYQFRIGPDGASMRRLMATLPEERKALWAGKAAAEY